ncbi:hypothetical protein HU730_016700 [Pseudomonas sp. SWRI22]|uniref:hypothetical protein n=1 Tax=Pseudomonas sp. SWRI22 TaxID=2745513 RepID=UPI001647F855|nr:hypothetical protein [Pseudomonas sp. SWRI22]MBV4511693.1 hypothetical protein [Pseudomonas sp. SWRI22]
MKSTTVSATPKIRLTGDTGTAIEVDISNLNATPDQKIALEKLLSSGDLNSLDQSERDLIKDLKTYVGLGTITPQFLDRFDTTWVKIDEI